MILSVIVLVFTLLHHFDNRCDLETNSEEIPEIFCEARQSGICVLDYTCAADSIIPTPPGHETPFTCPQDLGPNRKVVCCEKESPKPCRREGGHCMDNCGISIRKPSADCPKSGKMCCVLVH